MPYAKTPTTTYGVELEFGVRSYDVYEQIKSEIDALSLPFEMVTDGSVNFDGSGSGVGGELRSVGGHELTSLLSGLKKALKVVRKYEMRKAVKVNQSAGFHVHIGIAEWTLSDIRAFYRSFVKSLDSWIAFQPKSRWENSYCHDNRRGNTDEDSDFWKAFKRNDRYYMVNLQSMMKHETIELRLFAGTVVFFKVEKTLRLVNAFVKGALLKKDEDVDLLDAVDNKKLLAFIQSRIRKCHKNSRSRAVVATQAKLQAKLEKS